METASTLFYPFIIRKFIWKKEIIVWCILNLIGHRIVIQCNKITKLYGLSVITMYGKLCTDYSEYDFAHIQMQTHRKIDRSHECFWRAHHLNHHHKLFQRIGSIQLNSRLLKLGTVSTRYICFHVFSVSLSVCVCWSSFWNLWIRRRWIVN